MKKKKILLLLLLLLLLLFKLCVFRAIIIFIIDQRKFTILFKLTTDRGQSTAWFDRRPKTRYYTSK